MSSPEQPYSRQEAPAPEISRYANEDTRDEFFPGGLVIRGEQVANFTSYGLAGTVRRLLNEEYFPHRPEPTENAALSLDAAVEQVFAIGEREAQLDNTFIAMSPDVREAFTIGMAAEMKDESMSSPKASAITFLLGRISLADSQDKTIEGQRYRLRLVFFNEVERQ